MKLAIKLTAMGVVTVLQRREPTSGDNQLSELDFKLRLIGDDVIR